ncbi:MAG: hypothetical protein J5855_11085 [Mailhella sp.]|nr:hypothetical protein [Mailhella sp.]
MDKERKEALQTAKEITVKFIEAQRVSPSNFAEIFPSVFSVVYNTITEFRPAGGCDEDTDQ